jgi:vacuolar protein-sorting-associated protein 4
MIRSAVLTMRYRLIKQLFQLAREKKPSIIFIDEIDALCGARDAAGANQHMLGLKTELLVQMDGVGNDNDGVLLLGATNLPWTLDPAVRRRFQRKIHIPLPNEKARRQLIKITADKIGVKLAKTDYVELGTTTEGCSGSDISNALQDALMIPIKKVQTATHYRKVSSRSTSPFEAIANSLVDRGERKAVTDSMQSRRRRSYSDDMARRSKVDAQGA